MNKKSFLKFTAYALLFLGVPFLAEVLHDRNPQSVLSSILGMSYIFLIIPFGILKSVDYYKSNSGNSLVSRTFNVLFRAPLALFGLICLAIGISIIVWVLYNELIEKQESYPGGFKGFGMGIPILLLGWGILRSVFRRQETFDLPDDRNKIHNLDDGEADNGDGIPR